MFVRKEIHGEIGMVKLERVQITCPACGQQVEAVASDGRVKGYCAVANKSVDFLMEIQRGPIGKLSEWEKRRAVQLHNERLSVTEIARALGRGRKAIDLCLVKAGLREAPPYLARK